MMNTAKSRAKRTGSEIAKTIEVVHCHDILPVFDGVLRAPAEILG